MQHAARLVAYIDGRRHAGLDGDLGEQGVALLWIQTDLGAVVGLGLAIGSLLHQGVRTQVGQAPLQHAVDGVVERIQFDLYRQIQSCRQSCRHLPQTQQIHTRIYLAWRHCQRPYRKLLPQSLGLWRTSRVSEQLTITS